jgi:hypothetical protein
MARPKLPSEPAEWGKLFKDIQEDAEDRTAVLLGATLVEAALERMLLSWLVSEKAVEDFFDPMKSDFLSTFGAKKNLAYALGLLEDENEKKLVQAVASIRNVFAHHMLDATFAHPLAVGPMKTLRALFDAKFPDWTPTPSDRTVFVGAVRNMALALNMRCLDPRTAKRFRSDVQQRVKRQWVAAARRVRRKRSQEAGK